ncbi:MAG: hypothetical protein WC145_11950 [Aliarcobacter sp.]
MAHIIDITSKLEAAKPIIKIGDKEYEVNDDKNVVLKMQQGLLSEDEDSFNQMVAALEALFGKDKLKEIEQDNPGITKRVSLIQVLFKSILAAVEGVSYEVVEARFRTDGG